MQAKRYYFHFSDLNRDLFERDWKGRICFSEDEASAYAHSMVRELSANSNLRGSMLIVSDDSGKKIETITVWVSEQAKPRPVCQEPGLEAQLRCTAAPKFGPTEYPFSVLPGTKHNQSTFYSSGDTKIPVRTHMRTWIKKIGIAGLAALSVAGATLAASSDAEAHWRGRHWGGGGWVGPAIVGGLALGALAASRPYYGYAAYGYYDGCIRNRVVGYTYHGRPIVRRVNVCYWPLASQGPVAPGPFLSGLWRDDLRDGEGCGNQNARWHPWKKKAPGLGWGDRGLKLVNVETGTGAGPDPTPS
jgi:hypothetical protein